MPSSIFLFHVKAIDKDGKPWRADILKAPAPFRIVPVNGDKAHSPSASKRPRREDIIAEVRLVYGVSDVEVV